MSQNINPVDRRLFHSILEGVWQFFFFFLPYGYIPFHIRGCMADVFFFSLFHSVLEGVWLMCLDFSILYQQMHDRCLSPYFSI